MNDDVITYLNEEEPINETKEKENIDTVINNEFINGLPDWDLVPPYEVIKRSNL